MRFVFQISKPPKKITPNHYPELEISISCLLLWAEISNLKLRIVIWSNFFFEIWRFEKLISLSEKKATFNKGPVINQIVHTTYVILFSCQACMLPLYHGFMWGMWSFLMRQIKLGLNCYTSSVKEGCNWGHGLSAAIKTSITTFLK